MAQEFTYKKLSKEEQERRGILGRLVGVIADFKQPTRNGRLYNEEVWNKVLDDPIFKEKIDNRVCLGELGHPSDRMETDISKSAICLAEMPKKRNGKLYGVFDILDTPCGNILKTLCDYGCHIGISSRGEGELETDSQGNEQVDPDSYELECWDAVLIPAVKDARLTYVNESINDNQKSLKQALNENLNKANKKDRAIMEEVIDELNINLDETKSKEENKETNSTKDKDLDLETTLDKDIEEKEEDKEVLNETSKDDTQVINTSNTNVEETDSVESLDKEEKEDEEDSLSKGIDEVLISLKQTLKERDTLERETKKLQEQLAVRNNEIKSLRKELNGYKDNTIRLSEVASSKKKVAKQLQEQLRNEKLKTAKAKRSNETNVSLQENLSKSKEQVSALKEELESANTKVNSLEEKVDNLTKETNNYTRQIERLNEELKQASTQAKGWEETANELIEHYISSQATMYGVSEDEIKNRLPNSYTLDDIDKACKQVQSYTLDIGKLPFATTKNAKVKINEDKNDNLKKVVKNLNNYNDDEVDDSLLKLSGLN